MRLLVVLVAVVAAVPVTAQSLPFFSWPAEGTPTPTTTSVPVAYAASAGTTVALLGGGLLLARAGGRREDGELTELAYAGIAIAGQGVIWDPTVGNALLLGRDASASRGITLRMYGFTSGLALAGSGLLLCLAEASSSCTNPLVMPLIYAGGAVFAAGIIGGTVYDFVVIPRNAARAREAVLEREARRAVQVGLAPVRGRPGVFAVVPL